MRGLELRLSVNPVDAVRLLPHGSVHIEIHGGPDGGMAQDGGHGLAVHTFLQAGRSEAVAHGMEVAILHLASLEKRFEPLLHIAGLGAGIFPWDFGVLI